MVIDVLRFSWFALTHDIKVAGTIGTVGGSHHPLVGDEGTSAEPGVVNEKGNLVPQCYIEQRG